MRFIRAEKGKLYDGEREFRFFSLAAPNLHQNESQLHPDGSNRWPDEFESRDLMETLRQMGGEVTRSFGLSIHIPGEADGHLLGLQSWSEPGFAAYDRALAVAGELGIRVIFPFIDSHSFPNVRGIDEFCAWRDKPGLLFWTDPQLKEDMKELMHDVLNRRNTITGQLYKDDPTILAWQLGNELDSYYPDRGLDYDEGLAALTPWSLEMADFLQAEDSNHLVMEAGGLREVFLDSPSIDLLSDHYYEYWNRLFGKPYDLAAIHEESMAKIDGRKPLLVDEFGLAEMSNLERLMDAIIASGCSGGLLWSTRTHRRDGGFYCHNEGGTNVNSYHWPGFASADDWHETETLNLLRRKAFQIRGEERAPMAPPPWPPVLLSADQGQLIWRGTAGAARYRVERSHSDGTWQTLTDEATDSPAIDVVAFENSGSSTVEPLFVDSSPGPESRYRVVAINSAGESAPSNILPTF
jgi:mannan endo-1,4-beta-mannosidase